MHMTDTKWLWLLVLPGVLAVAYPFIRLRPKVRWTRQEALASVMIKGKGLLRHTVAVLLLLMMIGAVLIAARPAYATRHEEPRSAVMLVLDVSTSMTATDVAPTRLDAAKAAMIAMVKEAPADLNIGLVTVAGNSKLVVSPTLERAELLDHIQKLVPEKGGTATGEGIISATEALNSVSGFGSSEALPARIFLVSDGKEEIKDGLRDTDVAVKEAVSSGYPVFTVNYGTANGEINGQPIRSDPATLAAIASATHGQSFQAATQGELETALRSIPGAVTIKTTEALFPRWMQLAAIISLMLLAFCFVALIRA